MPDTLRIGTRESELALWQANFIKDQLAAIGVDSELITIKSDGEKDLTTPLYEMGVQGIFTKTLDIALLQGRIDLAVHSLKDVPTQQPAGLCIAAIPERGNHRDVLVYKNRLPDVAEHYTVATSSLRRSAQWLHRFGQQHTTESLRGNINTRVRKLMTTDDWDGALFAAAGIERIHLNVPHMIELDWMIPAPAQGALAVVARTVDEDIRELCSPLNHQPSAVETLIERSFLRILEGGCSMPVGALAEIRSDTIFFEGCVLTTDGARMARVTLTRPVQAADSMAAEAAAMLLRDGGREIIQTFGKA